MLAPVAIFIYNRPNHLLDLICDLKKCAEYEQSTIIVYGDGPKNERDAKLVDKTRQIAKANLGPNTTYQFATSNVGLANSIIAGVGEQCSKHGRVIVLEDDLRISPSFLKFVNQGLEHFSEDDSVFQISGHVFNVPEISNQSSAIMLPLTTTWGWGTWSRAWRNFDVDASGSEMLKKNKSLRYRFNLDGTYDYATMLEEFKNGKNSSWGIRWYWSVFKANGKTLYPSRTLVRNAGFDGSGTHGRGFLRKYKHVSEFHESANTLPASSEVDPEIFKFAKIALRRLNGGMLGKLADLCKKLLIRT